MPVLHSCNLCFINNECTVGLISFSSGSLTSKKNLATFSDKQPFTRAAEMPSCFLMDNTGCLFDKGGPGSSVGIATELRAGRSGIE